RRSIMRTILFQSITDDELAGGENTFRAGDKWADLRPGERVNLALTATPDQPFAQGVVRGVVVDCLGILLAGHASQNHGVMHSTEDLGQTDAEMLKDVLEGIYGPQEGHETFTVVYLD